MLPPAVMLRKAYSPLLFVTLVSVTCLSEVFGLVFSNLYFLNHAVYVFILHKFYLVY